MSERKGAARVIYVPDHVWAENNVALSLALLEERFAREAEHTLELLSKITGSVAHPVDSKNGSSPS